MWADEMVVVTGPKKVVMWVDKKVYLSVDTMVSWLVD